MQSASRPTLRILSLQFFRVALCVCTVSGCNGPRDISQDTDERVQGHSAQYTVLYPWPQAASNFFQVWGTSAHR